MVSCFERDGNRIERLVCKKDHLHRKGSREGRDAYRDIGYYYPFHGRASFNDHCIC